jgi:hypothetical protein
VRRRARQELKTIERSGSDRCLVSFDAVTAGRLLNRVDRGVGSVLIADVKGSVDKPCKFTPSFYPAEDGMKGRWKRVYGVTHGMIGYHPVDLYLNDDVYFVVDGHYRVSVVKALGGVTIHARIQEWV